MNNKTAITAECSIHNRFDIEVIDAKTGVVRERAQAFNVVCDALWNRFLGDSRNKYVTHVIFGSGSGVPSKVDTGMFTYVGAKQTTAPSLPGDVFVDRLNGVAQYTYQVTVAENEFVGSMLSEVGLGYDATHCVTHAMLVDMNGNPITIEKTNADILNIYATVFLHYDPHGYADGKIRLFELDTGMIYRILGLTGYGAGFGGALTYCDTSAVPMMVRSNGSTAPHEAVTLTSDISRKTITATVSRFVADNHNSGSIAVTTVGFYNNMVSPSRTGYTVVLERGAFGAFTVTNESVGTGDGSRTEFDTAFDFPYDAQISVNGVRKTSGVTVYEKPSNRPSMWYIRKITPQSTPSLILYDYNNYAFDSYKNIRVPGVNVSPTPILLCNYENVPLLGTVPKTISRYNRNYRLEGSDDLSSWTILHDFSDNATQLSATYRFYRIATEVGSENDIDIFPFSTGHNIVFSEPPAVGDIITVSYKTGCIPKDADHVFDFSVTLHFGDYVPE